MKGHYNSSKISIISANTVMVPVLVLGPTSVDGSRIGFGSHQRRWCVIAHRYESSRNKGKENQISAWAPYSPLS